MPDGPPSEPPIAVRAAATSEEIAEALSYALRFDERGKPRRGGWDTAKSIVFVTLEDEFGIANLVVYTDLGARDRSALIGAKLLVAEGRIERETEHAEVPITRLICRKLVDCSGLLGQLGASERDAALGDAAPDRVGAARQSSPGLARPRAGRPASRDFR
jgi:error-prone DNA polymerase